MGWELSLIPEDFTKVLKLPKALIIGCVNQFIVLPLLAFLLIQIFHTESYISIGVMILAVCPGGVTSNIITRVCSGNLALSVTFMSVASIASVITVPLILVNRLSHFSTKLDMGIKLSYIKTVMQIIAIVLLPIIIGMSIRNYTPILAGKVTRYLKLFSVIIFILILLSILLQALQ